MPPTIEERLAAAEATIASMKTVLEGLAAAPKGKNTHDERLVNIEHLLGVVLPLKKTDEVGHLTSLGNHDTRTEEQIAADEEEAKAGK